MGIGEYCLGRVGRLGNDAKSSAFFVKNGFDLNLKMKAFLKKNGRTVP